MIDVHLGRLTWFDNVKNINKSLIRNLTCTANGRNFFFILDHAQVFDKIGHSNQLISLKNAGQTLIETIGHLAIKTNGFNPIFLNHLCNLFKGKTALDNIKTFY